MQTIYCVHAVHFPGPRPLPTSTQIRIRPPATQQSPHKVPSVNLSINRSIQYAVSHRYQCSLRFCARCPTPLVLADRLVTNSFKSYTCRHSPLTGDRTRSRRLRQRKRRLAVYVVISQLPPNVVEQSSVGRMAPQPAAARQPSKATAWPPISLARHSVALSVSKRCPFAFRP